MVPITPSPMHLSIHTVVLVSRVPCRLCLGTSITSPAPCIDYDYQIVSLPLSVDAA